MNLLLLHVRLNVKSLIHIHASANLLNLVRVSVKLCKSILSYVKKLTFMFACQLHNTFSIDLQNVPYLYTCYSHPIYFTCFQFIHLDLINKCRTQIK